MAPFAKGFLYEYRENPLNKRVIGGTWVPSENFSHGIFACIDENYDIPRKQPIEILPRKASNNTRSIKLSIFSWNWFYSCDSLDHISQ